MYIRDRFSRAVALTATLLVVVSTTSLQADVVRTPISSDSVFSSYMSSCLLQGGSRPPFTDHVPAICCATNEEGLRWCVACYGGTAENPRDCSVTTPARLSTLDILRPHAPGGGVMAPTPDTSSPSDAWSNPLLQLYEPAIPQVVAPSN
jgi:hypothetical protein